MGRAYYQGNCTDSFNSDTGECLNGLFDDVSDFARRDENRIELLEEDIETFATMVDVPEHILYVTKDHQNKYYFYDGNIWVLHDLDDDIHYFFKKANEDTDSQRTEGEKKVLEKLKLSQTTQQGDLDVFETGIKTYFLVRAPEAEGVQHPLIEPVFTDAEGNLVEIPDSLSVVYGDALTREKVEAIVRSLILD